MQALGFEVESVVLLNEELFSFDDLLRTFKHLALYNALLLLHLVELVQASSMDRGAA